MKRYARRHPARRSPARSAKPKLIAPVRSLAHLRQLASIHWQYLQLAIIAAENLGGEVWPPSENASPDSANYRRALRMAMDVLNMNAMETDEDGVVEEEIGRAHV